MRFGKIAGYVPDMLEHLEGGHDLRACVPRVERAAARNSDFVCAVEVRSLVARACGGEPRLVGTLAATIVEHARTLELELRQRFAYGARQLAQHIPVGLPDSRSGPPHCGSPSRQTFCIAGGTPVSHSAIVPRNW